MGRRLLLSLLCILLFSKGSGNTSDDLRLKLETGFNEFDVYSVSFDSSRSFFLDLMNKSGDAGFWDIAIAALYYLAYISEQNKQYEVMQDALVRGQNILRDHQAYLDSTDADYSLRSNLVLMSGFFYARNNELEKAENTFLSLIQRLNKTSTPDKAAIFRVYTYITDLYMDRGLYEKVFNYYVLMEKSIPDGDYHDLYSFTHLLYLGTYYYRKKEFTQALTYIRTSLKKIEPGKATGEWKSKIVSYNELLALIYQGLNKYDSAMFFLKKSLDLQHPDDPTITDTYEIYGDCLSESNDLRPALDYYEKVYERIKTRKSYSTFRKAQILSKISETQLKLNDHLKALQSAQMAFVTLYNDSDFIRNPLKNPSKSLIQADKVLIRLMRTKANTLFELARNGSSGDHYLKSSLATYQLATYVLDKFRHEINTDDFKEFFVNDIRPMFENALKAAFLAWENSKHDSLINLAFYFMEKSKSQVLLDAIRTDYATTFSNIPNEVIASEKRFKNKLVELQNLIYNLKSGEDESLQLTRAQIEFAETQTRYDEMMRELENNYPAYYNLKYNTEVPAINDVRRIVRDGILIEYSTGRDYIGIIAVSKSRLLFRLIDIGEDFDENLKLLLSSLGDFINSEEASGVKGFTDFVNSANSLYLALLDPVLRQLPGSDHLIIIPDGLLGFLPFDVLIEKKPDNLQLVDYANLNYLIKSYAVRYEYSAVLLYENFHSKRKGRFRNSYIGFAPVYNQEESLKRTAIRGGKGDIILTPLKFNDKEVGRAAKIFSGKAFIGDKASISNFKGSSLSAKIVHFAGHTLIDDSIADLSGLFFSAETDEKTTESDSRGDVIYLNELLNLDMNSGLVILSACESGTGKLVKGEGLISIGRAFRYAGSQSMIMSLWKINDLSASEIIGSFCNFLKKGKARDVALRRAKLEYLTDSRNAGSTHPYYWSAFVMIGDNEPLFNRRYIWLLIPGLVLMLFIIYYLVARRVHNRQMK
jgi:CHAT domain-containing protein